MPSALSILPPSPLLILGTAIGYALATVGMKLVSQGHTNPGILLAGLGFLAAFVAKILLMRRADLSVVYIAIIAAETLLVMLYASWIGEGLSLRQTLGALMVLAGLAVVAV
ncbi:5-aminolevulinate synthase [Salipiger sp. P9]|uniref:5-aminolevulinate synthase n=1 Tax=Salipiger pentaromativorans TaxID=2943193 RepID=UPI00215842C3|nr:5-aminolevulinate synthase [Salipiger pentaromativorans]MCR8546316.1 5-aminolevulinate synthase [Salipiger pentaromativorans]